MIFSAPPKLKLFGRLRFWKGECVYLYDKLRYRFVGGTVESRTMGVDCGHCSEIGFFENDQLVGYWAYGCFDPSMPYTGQKKVKVTEC